MTNAELIKALQCASHFALYQDCYEKNCYANSGKGLCCNIPKLMADAADALEAADKRIDGLQKLVDINTERCEALRKQLRESHEGYEKHINELTTKCNQLQAAVDNYEKRIAELMPKEGKWIATSAEVDGSRFTGERCSRCGWWKSMGIYHYCPNCGAKMKGEQE